MTGPAERPGMFPALTLAVAVGAALLAFVCCLPVGYGVVRARFDAPGVGSAGG